MARNPSISPTAIAKSERLEKAMAARRQRMPWWRVAEIAGYSDGPTALRAVKNYVTSIANSEDAKFLRAEEAQHLDDLQMKYIRPALQGDLKSAEFVLKVIDRRIRLHGLDVNEGRIASAAEAQALAEMATTIALHSHLIAAMIDAGIEPEQMDRVIDNLNSRIGPREGDIEGEVDHDGSTA